MAPADGGGRAWQEDEVDQIVDRLLGKGDEDAAARGRSWQEDDLGDAMSLDADSFAALVSDLLEGTGVDVDELTARMAERASNVARGAQLSMLGAAASPANESDLDTYLAGLPAALVDEWGNPDSAAIIRIVEATTTGAIGAASDAALLDPDSNVAGPYVGFFNPDDASTSLMCSAIAEPPTVLPAGHPYWTTHSPPLHFGALAADVLITTRRGLVPIGEVLPGDEVLTHRRRWRTVTANLHKVVRARRLFAVHFDGGALRATEEHPILVVGTDGAPAWRRAGDVRAGDELFRHGALSGRTVDATDAPACEHGPPGDDEAVVARWSDVLPRLPQDDGRDSHLGDAKVFADRCLRFTHRVPSSDLDHKCAGEPREGVALPADHAFGVKARSVAVPSRQPLGMASGVMLVTTMEPLGMNAMRMGVSRDDDGAALRPHLLDVGLLCALDQMGRVHAPRVVADRVHDHEPLPGRSAIGERPREHVRTHHLASDAENAVAVPALAARPSGPGPAPRPVGSERASLVDVGPETTVGGVGRIDAPLGAARRVADDLGRVPRERLAASGAGEYDPHVTSLLEVDHERGALPGRRALFVATTVTRIDHHVEPEVELCDLSVDEDESYVAGGVVVHNCRSWLVSMSAAEAASIGIRADGPDVQSDAGFGSPGAYFGWAPVEADYFDEGNDGAGGLNALAATEPAGGNQAAIQQPPPASNVVDRYRFAGFPVSIENKAGSVRRWHDADGNESGSTLMRHDYGFFDGHLGQDKEELDVYIGPDERAPHVHVVHQLRAPAFKTSDEDKVMLGFPSADGARAAYLAHRNDGDRAFGGMSVMPLETFRAKIDRRRFGMDAAGKIHASAVALDFNPDQIRDIENQVRHAAASA